MIHGRSLSFEALEERKLLSRGHIGSCQASGRRDPVVLNGTLTSQNKGTTVSMDDQGDTTTSIPVSGQLGTLGRCPRNLERERRFRGGLPRARTLQLHNAKGSFIVAFNADNPGQLHRIAGGGVYYQHPQLVSGGTRAYARATESGTIELNTNSARTVVER